MPVAAGTAQPAPGSTTCVACTAGTFAATPGASTCDSCTPTCPPGQYEEAACTASSDTGCAGLVGRMHGEHRASDAGSRSSRGRRSSSIKDKAVDTKDVLKWKWAKGAATSLGDFGDPTTTDGYLLCLVRRRRRVASIALPQGGVCAGKPCWSDEADRLQLQGQGADARWRARCDQLKAGIAGKASAKVTGKGVNLPTPNPIGFTGPIAVQLQRADHAICFGTTFSAPFKKNEGGMFADTA